MSPVQVRAPLEFDAPLIEALQSRAVMALRSASAVLLALWAGTSTGQSVLGVSRDYIADRLKQGHSEEQVTRKIPVYVSYFTAWPTLAGKVEYFNDVYDRDSYVLLAIQKTETVRQPAG